MNVGQLRERLQEDRKNIMVSIRMPEDVVDDLKRIAPLLGFSGYQSLMRTYIGQGVRADLARLEKESDITRLIESLRRQGVNEGVLETAVAEARVEYHLE